MNSYFDGMLYGLVFILALGPAFFALFQTALKNGFKSAVCVSIGVNMTDAVLIAVILLGLGPFLENLNFKVWLGLAGATVLVIYGLNSWRTAVKTEVTAEAKQQSYFAFWLKGVVLNGLNPMIALFWIGVIGTVAALGYDLNQQKWFFGGFLTTVMSVDVFKILLITRISGLFTEKRLSIANKIIGALFVIFGIRIIVSVLGWA